MFPAGILPITTSTIKLIAIDSQDPHLLLRCLIKNHQKQRSSLSYDQNGKKFQVGRTGDKRL